MKSKEMQIDLRLPHMLPGRWNNWQSFLPCHIAPHRIHRKRGFCVFFEWGLGKGRHSSRKANFRCFLMSSNMFKTSKVFKTCFECISKVLYSLLQTTLRSLRTFWNCLFQPTASFHSSGPLSKTLTCCIPPSPSFSRATVRFPSKASLTSETLLGDPISAADEKSSVGLDVQPPEVLLGAFKGLSTFSVGLWMSRAKSSK